MNIISEVFRRLVETQKRKKHDVSQGGVMGILGVVRREVAMKEASLEEQLEISVETDSIRARGRERRKKEVFSWLTSDESKNVLFRLKDEIETDGFKVSDLFLDEVGTRVYFEWAVPDGKRTKEFRLSVRSNPTGEGDGQESGYNFIEIHLDEKLPWQDSYSLVAYDQITKDERNAVVLQGKIGEIMRKEPMAFGILSS